MAVAKRKNSRQSRAKDSGKRAAKTAATPDASITPGKENYPPRKTAPGHNIPENPPKNPNDPKPGPEPGPNTDPKPGPGNGHPGEPPDDKDGPVGHVPERGKDNFANFIVMRYIDDLDGSGQYLDKGGRPLTAGTTFWESPCVWVTSSAGWNTPVAGEEATIFALVQNTGLEDAAGVVVRWWWANPSLAITEASAHLIGMQTGVFVPSKFSVPVECPDKWHVSLENGGHECVFAEAWVPFFDDITSPLDPVNDRHVCQKNLHVIEVAKAKSFSFEIGVTNITASRAEVQIRFRALPFGKVYRLLTSTAIAYNKKLRPTTGRMAIALDLGEARTQTESPNMIFPRRLLANAYLAVTGEAGGCTPADGINRVFPFEAWETRQLEVKGVMPEEAEPGQAFGFEINQMVGGVVVGGYTLLVVAGGAEPVPVPGPKQPPQPSPEDPRNKPGPGTIRVKATSSVRKVKASSKRERFADVELTVVNVPAGRPFRTNIVVRLTNEAQIVNPSDSTPILAIEAEGSSKPFDTIKATVVEDSCTFIGVPISPPESGSLKLRITNIYTDPSGITTIGEKPKTIDILLSTNQASKFPIDTPQLAGLILDRPE